MRFRPRTATPSVQSIQSRPQSPGLVHWNSDHSRDHNHVKSISREPTTYRYPIIEQIDSAETNYSLMYEEHYKEQFLNEESEQIRDEQNNNEEPEIIYQPSERTDTSVPIEDETEENVVNIILTTKLSQRRW
eukprot:UN02741